MPVKKEKHLYRRGNIWWVKIPMGPGVKPLFEPTGVRADVKNPDRVPDQAKAFRDKKLAQKHRNELQASTKDSVLIGELLDGLLTHYDRDGRQSTFDAVSNVVLAHLRPAFGNLRASRLTTAMLENYRDKRHGLGRAIATVNRELAYLRAALNIGRRRGLLHQLPVFPMRAENNARQGFLEKHLYHKLLNELPAHAKPMLVIGYHVGMRRTEVTKLVWSEVDLQAKQIRLSDARVKSGEGRTIPIYGEMLTCIEELWAARRPDVPWVITKNGMPLKTIKESWKQACIRAGMAGLLFHDLRRSAARNMDLAGIPRSVIMKILGHKTESMFHRYRIVSNSDIVDAASKMNAFFGTGEAAA